MNDLLICAEKVGYEAFIDGDQCFVMVMSPPLEVWQKELTKVRCPYNPLTNDAQAMELLKWLYHQNKQMSFPVDTCGVIMVIDGKVIHEPTLNEAIIKAVVAMEDTHE